MLIFGLIALMVSLTIIASWRRPAQQTSLLGGWVWSVVAVLSLATSLGLETLAVDSAALRLILNTAIFCPTISLFGARRPQHRGWNFIVLTLWGVLALPAADAVFLQGAEEIHLHGARRVFMAIMILASVVNHLFTRHAAAAACFGVAQALLLGEFLWSGDAWSPGRGIAACGIFVAAVIAWWNGRHPRSEVGWNRVWLDFRDLFGAIWGLRLIERVNAAARMSDWSVRLVWRELSIPAGTSVETMEGVETCLRAYLRRFVSPQWVERRLTRSPSEMET
ncbi:MAG: hypothetical protein AAGF97_11725 [Planctomycetota bacterium]